MKIIRLRGLCVACAAWALLVTQTTGQAPDKPQPEKSQVDTAQPDKPQPETTPDEKPKKETPPLVYVRMSTTLGDFVLELNHEKAPKTVDNFLAYADEGFYDGTMFHRIIKDFMIQGGGMTADYVKKETKDPVVNEATNGLKNVYGTIAMARVQNPHSATSQFFINIKPTGNAFLDNRDTGRNWGYCVFGKVLDGLDTIEAITNTPVHKDPRADGRGAAAAADTPVLINKVVRVDPAELKAVIKAAKDKIAKEKDAKVEANKENFEKAKAFVAGRGVDTSGGKFTDSGLWILHVKEGTGASPVHSDSVNAHYSGWLTDGTEFDSSVSRGAPSKFRVSGVIKGWTEALVTMKPGGKTYLIIPPDLAYGKGGHGASIPGDATLIFEIDLIEITE